MAEKKADLTDLVFFHKDAVFFQAPNPDLPDLVDLGWVQELFCHGFERSEGVLLGTVIV